MRVRTLLSIVILAACSGGGGGGNSTGGTPTSPPPPPPPALLSVGGAYSVSGAFQSNSCGFVTEGFVDTYTVFQQPGASVGTLSFGTVTLTGPINADGTHVFSGTAILNGGFFRFTVQGRFTRTGIEGTITIDAPTILNGVVQHCLLIYGVSGVKQGAPNTFPG